MLAREYVSTQGTLARERVSMQSTLIREHVSTQGTLAREHVFSTQGTQFSRLYGKVVFSLITNFIHFNI